MAESKPAWRPDWLRVPRSLLLLSVTQGLAALGAGFIIPLLAPLTTAVEQGAFPSHLFGVALTPELQVGLLFSILGVVRSAMQIPVGRLCDRIGRREAFVVGGMGLSAAVIAGYGFVETLLGLYGLRILHGVALAIATPALMVLVERAAPEDARGEGMGVFSTARTLGWGLGPMVGGAVSDQFGTTAAFVLGAAVVTVATLAVPRAVAGRVDDASATESEPKSESELEIESEPETESGPETGAGQETCADGGAVAARSDGFEPSRRERLTTLFGLAVGAATLMVGVTTMVAMENPLLARIEAGHAGFGLAFGVTTISRLVVQIPVGRLSDARGRKPLIVVGLLASAPVVAATGYVETLTGLVVVRAIQGVCLAGVVAPTYALAADVVERDRSGEQMAIVTTAFSFGFAVGPPVAGLLAGRGFAVPFLLAGSAAVVGALSVFGLVGERPA